MWRMQDPPQFLSDGYPPSVFCEQDRDRLVEQEMDVRYSSNVSKEKLIVEKLIHGPREQMHIRLLIRTQIF